MFGGCVSGCRNEHIRLRPLPNSPMCTSQQKSALPTLPTYHLLLSSLKLQESLHMNWERTQLISISADGNNLLSRGRILREHHLRCWLIFASFAGSFGRPLWGLKWVRFRRSCLCRCGWLSQVSCCRWLGGCLIFLAVLLELGPLLQFVASRRLPALFRPPISSVFNSKTN